MSFPHNFSFRAIMLNSIIVVFAIFLSSCGVNSDQSSNTIPIFDLECSAAQANDCDINGANKNFKLGLIPGVSAIPCSTMVQSVGTSFFTAFTISGSAVSQFDGFTLEASISSWVDKQGVSIDKIDSGLYTVCAYLDKNNNDLLDLNEAVSSSTVNLTLLTELINTWEDF